MRSLALGALLAGLLVLTTVPAAPAAEALTACRGAVLPGLNLEVTRLRERGTTCLRARALARAWARSQACNPDGAESEACQLRGYACQSTSGPGFRTTVACRAAGRRVRFFIGPR